MPNAYSRRMATVDAKRIQAAFDDVVKAFPFDGYVSGTGIDAYRTIADVVCRYLDVGDTILDFGAGPCDTTALLQHLGYRCFACDDLSDDWHEIGQNRQKILKFAAEQGVLFEHMKEPRLPASYATQSFDMAMLHAVIEHLHDSPRALLNDILQVVRSGGLLFITVPNAVNIRKRLDVLRGKTNLPRFDSYYWDPGPWRGHVREYVKGDLALLSEYLGLECLELRACDQMLAVVPHGLKRIYILLTKLFPGWKDSWLLVARKPENWTPRRSLPPQEWRKIRDQYTRYNMGEPAG